MFTREDYISIAKIIIGTEWDDESSVEKNSFRISQFQGTIFASDYQCFKVERDKDIMVAKITNRTEYSANWPNQSRVGGAIKKGRFSCS